METLFNYENIGRKIKNLAKWFCWIGILLIWLVSAILFIVLLRNGLTSLLVIPLVIAIVNPIIIWVSSWGIYAFGELVEGVSSIKGILETTKKSNMYYETYGETDVEARERALERMYQAKKAAAIAATAKANEEAKEEARQEALKRFHEEQLEEHSVKIKKTQEIKEEKEKQNAKEAILDMHNEGFCPYCKKAFTAERISGTQKCPHCKKYIKVVKKV